MKKNFNMGTVLRKLVEIEEFKVSLGGSEDIGFSGLTTKDEFLQIVLTEETISVYVKGEEFIFPYEKLKTIYISFVVDEKDPRYLEIETQNCKLKFEIDRTGKEVADDNK